MSMPEPGLHTIRHSSVAVDLNNNLLAAWCAQRVVNGVLDPDYRIMFRQGTEENTWQLVVCRVLEDNRIIRSLSIDHILHTGVQGNDYGIDIVYHRSNQEVHLKTTTSSCTPGPTA